LPNIALDPTREALPKVSFEPLSTETKLVPRQATAFAIALPF
jgi:hypothetical protein